MTITIIKTQASDKRNCEICAENLDVKKNFVVSILRK